MSEGLQTAEGATVPLDTAEADKDFAVAMTAPVDDPPAPPKRPATAGEPIRKRAPRREHARVSAPAATAKPSPELDAQRSDGIKGLVQLGAGLCLVLDARTPDSDIAFRADAVTLASNADALAAACVETARHSAGFAAVVDRVTQAGPYAALVSVSLTIAAQIASNHGMAAGEMLGAKPPEEILKNTGEQSDASQA